MTTLFYVILFIFLFVSIVLCFSILVQEAKSLGLGASFGGEGGDSLFGTSTAEVLKRFTAYVSCIFLTICFLLSVWTSSLGAKRDALPSPIPTEATPQPLSTP